MEKTFWLSFDLGLRGDYTNLYSWLDNHHAKECGNGLAVFKYVPQNLPMPDREILADMESTIAFAKADRLYLIWRDEEGDSQKLKGTFLKGGRRPAPWEGYGNLVQSAGNVVDE